MLRRSLPRGLQAIPRDAYDPMRHNTKWYDSYAKRMAGRRQWPKKKYSVGLEPSTLEDWLQPMATTALSGTAPTSPR